LTESEDLTQVYFDGARVKRLELVWVLWTAYGFDGVDKGAA
jgi:hypothetical protein